MYLINTHNKLSILIVLINIFNKLNILVLNWPDPQGRHPAPLGVWTSSLKISKLVGHKHTLETKLKFSQIASNRKFDLHKGLFISIKDVTTGIIKEYKSVREAAKDLKADTSCPRPPAKQGGARHLDQTPQP
jgi:hypothetical protein